jgi:hypothetical protein
VSDFWCGFPFTTDTNKTVSGNCFNFLLYVPDVFDLSWAHDRKRNWGSVPDPCKWCRSEGSCFQERSGTGKAGRPNCLPDFSGHPLIQNEVNGSDVPAVAAVNGVDVLVTWNFALMNNPFTRIMVRKIVENEGYLCPEICSPEELLETDK